MKNLKLIALFLLVLAACGRTTSVTVTQEVAISHQDFALDVVVGLLKSGVADGASLEAKINDPASGINNIDFDKDGKTDYVQVVEQQIPSGRKLELVAHASGGAAQDTVFAGIKFTQAGSEVGVEAGFAPLVDPGGSYFYRDTLVGASPMATWVFLPSRPIFYVRPIPLGYVYRPRLSVSTFSSTRSTFTSTTRVSPVRSTPRPPSFNAGRVTAPPRAPAQTLGGASKSVSGFSVDSRPKPSGIGFGGGALPRTTASPSFKSAPSFSRPSPSFSRPSFSGGRTR